MAAVYSIPPGRFGDRKKKMEQSLFHPGLSDREREHVAVTLPGVRSKRPPVPPIERCVRATSAGLGWRRFTAAVFLSRAVKTHKCFSDCVIAKEGL